MEWQRCGGGVGGFGAAVGAGHNAGEMGRSINGCAEAQTLEDRGRRCHGRLVHT